MFENESKVGFTHNGTWITNPYADDGGQGNPVDPESFYGFAAVSTGGGCAALQKDMVDGTYLMITDELSIPRRGKYLKPGESASDDEDILIGLYDADGNPVGLTSLARVLVRERISQGSFDERAIAALAKEALDAACLVIQKRMGIPSGDAAAMFFSGPDPARLEAYIAYEMSLFKAGHES